MSNWSKVILCWSGIDEAVPDVQLRLDAIAAFFAMRDDDLELRYGKVRWDAVSLPAADGNRSVGSSATETVVVGAANHFDAEALLVALRNQAWEFPEQVELFWKTEEHTTYQRRSLS
jgi:hypothetical protein